MFRITCNKEDAEDIVQDIMLKMWQMREEWDEVKCIDAYCCMMARHTAFGLISIMADNKAY